MAIPAGDPVNIGRIVPDLKVILDQYQVCGHVQSELGRLGYTDTAMVSILYDTEANLIAQVPGELGFAPGANNFDANSSKRERIRFQPAWNHARTLREHRQKLMTSNTQEDDIRLLVQGSIRESAEEVWNTKHGAKPPLEDQGTDAFLGRIYKDMGKK